jgi:Glutathione-dependent formaldehyde-activating enzyme
MQARWPADRVQIVRRYTEYRRTSDFGEDRSFRLCPDCGATVFWTTAGWPGIAVPIGAFADPSFPQPTVSVWESRNYPWLSLPAGWSTSRTTKDSVREVPLTRRALAALGTLPPRIDTPLLLQAPEGGPLNLDNFRKREWAPAVEAAGVDTRPRRRTTCATRSRATRSPQA